MSEVERNLWDAMNVARNIVLDPRLVPGGGASEMAVSYELNRLSKSIEGVRQVPYRNVALAMEVIPRTLIQNCGANVVRLITELRAKHAQDPAKNWSWGVDGIRGVMADMYDTGVWEPFVVKAQTFKSAIESACMLLRVDDILSGASKHQNEQQPSAKAIEDSELSEPGMGMGGMPGMGGMGGMPMMQMGMQPQCMNQGMPKPAPAVLEVGKRPKEPEPKYAYPEVKLPRDKRRVVETEENSSEAYLIFIQDNKFIKTKLSAEVPELTLGRHPDCKLRISREEPSVSRFHAVVKCLPAKGSKPYCKFVIRDQSSCGTALNNTRLTQPLELEDGDRLFFGGAPFSLFFIRPKTCADPSYEGEIQMLIGKKWCPFYACISRDVLLLFDKCNDPIPKFLIDLYGATTVASKKPPHSWTLTARGKSYNLATSSEDLADDWMKAISVAALNCRKNVLVAQQQAGPKQ